MFDAAFRLYSDDCLLKKKHLWAKLNKLTNLWFLRFSSALSLLSSVGSIISGAGAGADDDDDDDTAATAAADARDCFRLT